MKTNEIIKSAITSLNELQGHSFDLLTISKPISPEAAINLAKVISKLSPLVGNLIEFNTVEYLNDQKEFQKLGHWLRQDPGFPDAVFISNINPAPGFEIKAWYPLATEITARFKDSQNHFVQDQTYVVMLAWLLEYLIFGKPYIVDICVVSGASVAAARDNHYHNPPNYLVLEPEDTSNRTANLRQTNTNGYKFQGSGEQLKEARKVVSSWGTDYKKYKPTREYQKKTKSLLALFPYRLDTNFAKMDRIAHPEIELFKERVYKTVIHEKTIGEWNRFLSKGDTLEIKNTLRRKFGIIDRDSEEILE